MAVDEANGHVFVSGGPGYSSVVVLDFDGNVVTTIGDQPGASALALDSASGILYVALQDSNAISKIDTTTLAEVGRLSISPKTAPYGLALAGGRVWFSHNCRSGTSGMGSMATDGSDVSNYPRLPGTYPYYCPIFATSPTDPNALLATDLGISPPKLYVYDVESAGAPLTLTVSKEGAGGAIDMVVSPDGSTVLGPFGSPLAIGQFRLSDLAGVGSYSTGGFANSVAITSDGSYIAAGREGPWDPDLYIYEASSSTPQRVDELTLTMGTSAGTLYPGGLAYSGDRSRLFVVTHSLTSAADFRVLLDPTVPKLPVTVTVSASAKAVQYNHYVTLTAHVGEHGGGTLSIYATPYSGLRKLVRTATPNASGNVSGTFLMKELTTFTAEYSGDETYAKAWSAGKAVNARVITKAALYGYYGTSGRYRLYHRGRNPLIKGSVTPNHAGSYLTFEAQRYRRGAWRVADSAGYLISANGTVSARLLNTSRGSYRVRTRFVGDVNHLGDASPWRYLKVTL